MASGSGGYAGSSKSSMMTEAQKRYVARSKALGAQDIDRAQLDGSQKQVELASKIRNEAISDFVSLSNDLRNNGYADAAASAEKVARQYGKQKSASWIINNRENTGITATNSGQLANGAGWKNYTFALVRSNIAFNNMRGFKMKDSLKPIMSALSDLAEKSRNAY